MAFRTPTTLDDPVEGSCDPSALAFRSWATNDRTSGAVPVCSEGGIDVAFWFMTDDRSRSAPRNALSRGVRVRVLVNTSADVTRLGDAGIPANLAGHRHPHAAEEKLGRGDILHWKTRTQKKYRSRTETVFPS
jgi:hypothetical protein